MFAHTAVSSVPAPAFPGDLDPATHLPRRLGDWAKPRLQKTPETFVKVPRFQIIVGANSSGDAGSRELVKFDGNL